MAQENTFGSGIGLSEDFDLIADETGDLSVFTGMDELEKDLSLLVAFRASRVAGLKFDEQDKAKIRVRSRATLSEDPRVADVSQISVKPSEENPDRAVIDAFILTLTGETISFSTEV